jgi:hypothetical protein
MNSMTQGIILCYNDQSKYAPDQVFFLNDSIQELMARVIQHHPQLIEKMTNIKVASKKNTVNFLRSYDFLKTKMFIQKKFEIIEDEITASDV